MSDAITIPSDLQAPTTVGAYLKRRREQAGLTPRDVALMLAGSSSELPHFQADIEALERDAFSHGSVYFAVQVLAGCFPFDRQIAQAFAESDPSNPDLPQPQLCRVCACSWQDPCACDDRGTCAWATNDLCTRCHAQLSEGAAA